MTGAPAKWNWDLIEALYFAGMGVAEIIKQPEFAGMSQSYCQKQVSHYGWARKRAAAREFMVRRKLPRDVASRLDDVRERHVSTMLDVLDRERAVIASKPISVLNQRERLEILQKYDDIARKTLELDKEENNPVKKSLTFMLVLGTQAQARIRGLKQVSATYPLEGDKNATTGILSAANGHIEGEGEGIGAIPGLESAEGSEPGEGIGGEGEDDDGTQQSRMWATPDEILSEYRGRKPGGQRFLPPLEMPEDEEGSEEGIGEESGQEAAEG